MAVVDFFPETGANNDVIGASSAGLANVAPFSGGTGVISTEQAYIGTRSFKFTANSTNGVSYVYENLPGNQNLAIRFAVYITANPSARIPVFSYAVDAARPLQVHVGDTGLVSVTDAGFTTVWTSSSAIPLNKWLWFSVYAVQGDASTGQAALTIIDPSDNSVVMTSGTISSISTGIAPYTGFRVGAKTSTGTQQWAAVYFDYGQYNDAATGLLLPSEEVPPTLSVTRPAENVVDLRGSVAGSGSLTFNTPVRVSGPVLTVTNLALGLWLFSQDSSSSSVYTVSCEQPGGLTDSQNVTIDPLTSSGTVHANAPFIPSGSHPSSTWS